MTVNYSKRFELWIDGKLVATTNKETQSDGKCIVTYFRNIKPKGGNVMQYKTEKQANIQITKFKNKIEKECMHAF